MLNVQNIIISLTVLTLIGCGSDEKKEHINPSDVIIKAENLVYQDLSDLEKEAMIFTKCCCYPKNWNKGVDCKEKEESFYVKAKLNINLLAALSESNTFEIKDLINSNPHFLYGKYHNKWKFIDNDGYEICPTSKFDGHNDFNLIRKGSIDEVIIGPLPKRPKKMIIEIMDSKYYKGLIPEYKIN